MLPIGRSAGPQRIAGVDVLPGAMLLLARNDLRRDEFPERLLQERLGDRGELWAGGVIFKDMRRVHAGALRS